MRALIAGTSLLTSSVFSEWEDVRVKTPYGTVLLKKTEGYLFLQRHGTAKVPPHRINHHANIWAIESMGAQKVVAINSVGSLKRNIKPGMFLIPDDFFSPWSIPTFFETEMRFLVPRMDDGLAERLHRICLRLGMKVVLGGTYVQARGPRLETRAEVDFLKKVGDLVGMTLASEATLCLEKQMSYASICSVDNYCNGIVKKPLTISEIAKNATKNLTALEMLIKILVKDRQP
jgi:5'-methylthioadenosine phosphorylase